MHLWTPRRRPHTAAIAVGLLVLAAMAVALSLSSGGMRSTAQAPVSAPPVITIAWRSVGQDVDPWSGVGLGEQVKHALSALGATIVPDTGARTSLSTGSPGALAAVGRERHASYVLGGTIGRKGRRSEIGMQLVRVQDSATVWTSTFWRDPTDLESLALDLALTVAQVLESEASQ